MRARSVLPFAALATAALVLTGVALARGRDATPQPELTRKTMQKISLTIDGRTLAATLFDNPTARDFAATLPFDQDMRDLFRQEKAGRTARPLSTEGPAQHSFAASDIGYWSPSMDVAIYYRAGDELPRPGIIVIGRIDGDVSLLDRPGAVRVRFAHAD